MLLLQMFSLVKYRTISLLLLPNTDYSTSQYTAHESLINTSLSHWFWMQGCRRHHHQLKTHTSPEPNFSTNFSLGRIRRHANSAHIIHCISVETVHVCVFLKWRLLWSLITTGIKQRLAGVLFNNCLLDIGWFTWPKLKFRFANSAQFYVVMLQRVGVCTSLQHYTKVKKEEIQCWLRIWQEVLG